jgi:hypothetical protein
VKRITLLSTIATVSTAASDVDVSVNVTQDKQCPAGLVISYADTANMVVAYGAVNSSTNYNVRLEKCVAGTWTTVANGNATNVANKTLRVTKVGTSYSLYYNGSQISTTQTIAGLSSNTKQGIFSTYSGNSFGTFVIKTFP